VRVFERLSALSPSGLPGTSGDLLQRVVGDVEAMEDLYLRGLHPVAVAALASTAAVLVALLLLPAAALVLAAALVVGGVLVPAAAARAGARAGAELSRARGALAAEVVDTVNGAADLVAWGAADRHLDAVAALEAVVRRAERRQARVAAAGDSLGLAVHGLGLVGVLVVATSAARSGALDPVGVAALGFLALASYEAVAPLPAAWTGLGALRAAAARIVDVLDRPVPVAEPTHPRPLPDGPHHVAVRGARVSYDGGRTFALDGVDLDLLGGRTVALVGPSGAGKSTLAAALVRFVDLTGGSITLDGIDVGDLAGDDVRSVVGLVEQRPHLFHTTLRDNLLLARPGATDGELDEVAAQAGLDAWVRSLPSGWDTAAGEAGALMSGGERRRLALARALLAGFEVLVLDEPTADVDAAAAAGITARVLAVARATGRSVLLITHDQAGLDAVDEVVDLGARTGREPRGCHEIRANGPDLVTAPH
jgi:thiol reductant ABC exporter CydC subunit